MKLPKNLRGQSLVEFAIVLPFLLTLIIGFFYFCFMGITWFGAYRSAGNAAHEAAIHIVDGTTTCEMRALMGRGNPVFIGTENAAFTSSCDGQPLEWKPTSNTIVTTTWEFDFQPPLPFFSFSHHFTVTAEDYFR